MSRIEESRSALHSPRLCTPGSPKQTSTPARSSSPTMTSAPVDICCTLSLQTWADRPKQEGMARRLAFAALFAACAAHLACTRLGAPAGVAKVLYTGIEVGALGLIAARAVAIRRNRAGWCLMATG